MEDYLKEHADLQLNQQDMFSDTQLTSHHKDI
jgi:hypothetical protein